MLNLIEFRHNHHPSEVRLLAKFIRRGISVTDNSILTNLAASLDETIFYRRYFTDATLKAIFPNAKVDEFPQWAQP